MKIFAFIMAFLIMALSCIPCMDEVNGMENGIVKSVISTSTDHQDHDVTDNCSPFCACNCCAGFAVVFHAYQIENAFFLSTEKIASHLPSKILEVSLPVWQPPKLFV